MFGYQIYTVKQYEKINKNRDSYVATVTHDLKSPARAQISILSMLLKGDFGYLNRKQQELLKLTFGSTKYMSNLVGNILTKYECDYSKLRLNYTRFNLNELICSILKSNEWLLLEKEQKINFNCSNTEIFIDGDKLEIERVIFNLISNAITYGLKKSTITIELKNLQNYADFTISNYSYPLEQKDLEGLFKKFEKGKNSCFNATSTGLGLYVAKHIIEMHRGKIFANVDSNNIFTIGFKIPNIKQDLLVHN